MNTETKETQHFNGLTPAQAERFAMLAEEASEVVQICMKILRHGLFSYNPNDKEMTPNRELLTKELADFQAVLGDLYWWGDTVEPTDSLIAYSRAKKKRYAHHQEPAQ